MYDRLVPRILLVLAVLGCLGALYWSAWTAPDGDLPYTRLAPSTLAR
jgi:hypothetical protein